MDIRQKEVTTGLDMEKRTFTWRIKNFPIIRRFDELIRAQKFNFKAGETIGLETEWRVYFTVLKKTNGVGNDVDEDWIAVYLMCTKLPPGVTHVLAVRQISIVSSNSGYSRKIGDLKPESVVNFAPSSWGSWLFRKDGNMEDPPLIDGCLVLELEFHLYAPIIPPAILTATLNRSGSVVKQFEPMFMTKLQSDLESLLNSSSQASHVKIISMDGKEFEVNAGILSVRSPVFKAMLEVDMKEANTGVISIDDLSSKTVTVLLQFIYAGNLHDDWSSPDVIVPLLYAAAKYQLSDLLEFLDNVLGDVCSKETAGKLLNLAEKLGMKKAVQEILGRIEKDFSKKDDMMAVIISCSGLDLH